MKHAIQTISQKLNVSEKEAQIIFDKAVAGGEIVEVKSEQSTTEWIETRLLPNTIFIDETGYARMCIDALKILGITAATDYGGSRQRDLGQLWADMTRGYLGELAFAKFLEKKYNIATNLDHEKGDLKKYLPTDIHSIQRQGETEREPKITVGIKTTKWNGIWLDLPGDQFNHSDVHILVKVGTGRDHLFAYFKKISVFRDKVLKIGQEVGALSVNEADALFEALPTFQPIPAYICGFVLKNDSYQPLAYTGKAGRKNYKIMSWRGAIARGDLEAIKSRENVQGTVEFEAIGNFTHDSGWLFNTGSLRCGKLDWDDLISKI